MELPKRARTADWENGVLTLDGEKKFEIPELTMELMERLAGYTLVGFHVKDYPATDELLIPFAGHKSMANFGVDAGMGCIADLQTQVAFKTYWAKRLEEDPDIDPYNDLFCDLLEENAQAHPKYQGDCGDWLNWTVPDTDCNLPIFSSGWGDGYYPVYFGYDAKGEVCAVYVRFIDIEACYKEQA